MCLLTGAPGTKEPQFAHLQIRFGSENCPGDLEFENPIIAREPRLLIRWLVYSSGLQAMHAVYSWDSIFPMGTLQVLGNSYPDKMERLLGAEFGKN
jgi:hypothetical protein